MFKFFRKIRYDLMETGKSGKYLKYALSEIVLVVIGILIAFQVNNWNENRKAEEKQNNLFHNLSIDFESRLIELKEFNVGKTGAIKAILVLNSIIADQSSRPNEAVLDSLLSKTLIGFKFNEEFKMLDVVFNTGLINDIKNEKLKRQLIEWPQKVEEMLEEQRMHNTLIDDKLTPILMRYVSIRAIHEQQVFRQYNLPKGEPVTLPKNYDGLLSDPLFENYLAMSEMLMRITIIDIGVLISSAEAIITLLNDKVEIDN